MVLTLHHLENSRSQRVLWLLEELGIDYEIKHYKRLSSKLAPPELKQIHPLGKSPVITDNGVTIAETGLMVEYLIDKYGPNLAPSKSDESKTLQYKYWLHFSEGSAQPVLIMSLLLRVTCQQTPWLLRPLAKMITGGVTKFYVGPNIDQNTKFIDSELAKNPKGWQYYLQETEEDLPGEEQLTFCRLVDEFSGADIILSFPIECIKARAGLSEYPQLDAYLKKLQNRPAYKRALEKGGAYNIMA